METLTDTANTISPFMAILWCFYPIGALVFIELLLRAINDDDDDQDGGKGIRVNQAVPVAVPSGA
tara:strand:- start:1440 stop:1634 length:195 start_codon:yes stop_codon:yes gene_type:complete